MLQLLTPPSNNHISFSPSLLQTWIFWEMYLGFACSCETSWWGGLYKKPTNSHRYVTQRVSKFPLLLASLLKSLWSWMNCAGRFELAPWVCGPECHRFLRQIAVRISPFVSYYISIRICRRTLGISITTTVTSFVSSAHLSSRSLHLFLSLIHCCAVKPVFYHHKKSLFLLAVDIFLPQQSCNIPPS